MAVERTLAIVKPDAMAAGLLGELLKRIHEAKLKIVALKTVRLTKAQAEGFYAVHHDKPFFAPLTKFMSSGRVVVLVLEGKNAIARWRETMGATDPAKAAPGTIRQLFGANVQQNCVHGSDAPETAAFEIGYFFAAHELL